MQSAYRLSSTLSDSYQDKTTTLMIKKRNVYDIKHGFVCLLYGFQMVVFVRFAGVVIRQGAKHRSSYLIVLMLVL